MFGFACDETPDLMPATLYYSHKILERMAADRHSGAAPFLEPDAKSQVTLRYEDGKPVAATAIVVSTQHAKGYDEGDKEAELHAYVKRVVADVLPGRTAARDETDLSHQPDRQLRDRRPGRRRRPDRPQDHRRHLWRRGPARRRRVHRQGPDQGRPLGRLYHAAISPRTSSPRASPSAARSSSPTRSASPKPLSLYVDTARHRHGRRRRGSRRRSCDRQARRPDPARHPHASRPQQADLPQTAAYGHFGRKPEGDFFPWEKTDLVDDLKAALG